MYYDKWFYIDKNIWNNSFSFEERKNKKIFVAKLIKANIWDNIELQNDIDKIAFEFFDSNNILHSNYWLKNFYEFDILDSKNKFLKNWWRKKIFLFDNHNHALYFWYLARYENIIQDNSLLFHVDEHSDMSDSLEYISKIDTYNMYNIFQYTNFSKINIWNYIIPAKKEWIIWDIIQIRNETNLEDYMKNFYWKLKNNISKQDIILNLDLDFFQKNLSYIDYNLKKKIILDIYKYASIISVASSPFFIEQKLAIDIFKDLFFPR